MWGVILLLFRWAMTFFGIGAFAFMCLLCNMLMFYSLAMLDSMGVSAFNVFV